MTGQPGWLIVTFPWRTRASSRRRCRSSEPDPVVQVERGSDLPRYQVDRAAEGRCRPHAGDDRVLVIDDDLLGLKINRDGRAVLCPDDPPPDVDNDAIWMTADDRAANMDRASERKPATEELGLHQRVHAGLDLGDGRFRQRLVQRRCAAGGHDSDWEAGRQEGLLEVGQRRIRSRDDALALGNRL